MLPGPPTSEQDNSMGSSERAAPDSATAEVIERPRYCIEGAFVPRHFTTGRGVAMHRIFILAAMPLAGCIPSLPENVDVPLDRARSVEWQAGDATYFLEQDLPEGGWLEVGRDGDLGPVGGYLFEPPDARPALVVVLPGASSFATGGMLAKARDYHQFWLAHLHEAGLPTWTLAVRECGTPYGDGDLEDVLDALDWLEREGKSLLGVERVYLLGYSSGAIAVLLANLERDVDAMVVISALTQPDQLERFWGFYRFIASLYPNNAGLCQFADTLEAYGPPGSSRWAALDVVGRVRELRSPTLVIHGEDDLVYSPENARLLQVAYERELDGGARLPPVEFFYVPNQGHIDIFNHPPVEQRVVDYLLEFED